MSIEPRWWPQPFAPEGSAASEGIRQQLGRSSLDPLSVLIREAAQNSWDARRDGRSVQFSIDLRRLDREAVDVWRRMLLPETGPAGSFGLTDALAADDVTVLTVSDRGTTGLGGPLRADEVSADPPDFINFIRNVGEPRDKDFGGGTYGFGKGIFFTLSAARTIIVRTRCRWMGRLQTRLMGSALGDSFVQDHRRYTGRHWWGLVGADGLPDPLLDEEAEDVVRRLRLPERHPDELGTDIVVVGACLGVASSGDLEDADRPRTLTEAGTFLASALVWNLWPKMLAEDGGSPPMRFRLTVGGGDVPIPEPATLLRLRPFVNAHRRLGDEEPLVRFRPRKTLGQFATAEFMAPLSVEPLDVAAPFEGPARHCALLRQAELVVSYREGPAHPDQMLQYGAVFRSDPDVDNHFAAAEPPTHDQWEPAQLSPDARRIVRMALQRIDDRLRQVFAVANRPTDDPSAPDVALGGLAHELSTLMPAVSGTGASAAAQDQPRNRGSSTGGVVRAVGAPRLADVDGETRVVAEVEILSSQPVRLEVLTTVALDSASEHDPPAGASCPEVLEIRASSGTERFIGSSALVLPDHSRRYLAVIMPAPATITRVRFVGTPMVPDVEVPRRPHEP